MRKKGGGRSELKKKEHVEFYSIEKVNVRKSK